MTGGTSRTKERFPGREVNKYDNLIPEGARFVGALPDALARERSQFIRLLEKAESLDGTIAYGIKDKDEEMRISGEAQAAFARGMIMHRSFWRKVRDHFELGPGEVGIEAGRVWHACGWQVLRTARVQITAEALSCDSHSIY